MSHISYTNCDLSTQSPNSTTSYGCMDCNSKEDKYYGKCLSCAIEDAVKGIHWKMENIAWENYDKRTQEILIEFNASLYKLI